MEGIIYHLLGTTDEDEARAAVLNASAKIVINWRHLRETQDQWRWNGDLRDENDEITVGERE